MPDEGPGSAAERKGAPEAQIRPECGFRLARIPDEFVPQELLCARPQIRVLRQALGNKVVRRKTSSTMPSLSTP
jgi:hypothetical protein